MQPGENNGITAALALPAGVRVFVLLKLLSRDNGRLPPPEGGQIDLAWVEGSAGVVALEKIGEETWRQLAK